MGKKTRRDKQKSGLAGELFAAAELLKRDYQVSVTMGNAKAVDLFVQREDTARAWPVEVKTLRNSNCYIIRADQVLPETVHVFVLLHKPGQEVEYFIARGAELLEKRFEVWGRDGGEAPFAGITVGRLRALAFKDRWELFERLGSQESTRR